MHVACLDVAVYDLAALRLTTSLCFVLSRFVLSMHIEGLLAGVYGVLHTQGLQGFRVVQHPRMRQHSI
jgi:hypothetical protein